jgi:hypothetical protein
MHFLLNFHGDQPQGYVEKNVAMGKVSCLQKSSSDQCLRRRICIINNLKIVFGEFAT